MAQGVLLDESYGFYPHVTWTDTTTRNALRLLDEAGYRGPVRKLEVVRTYATRHGAGPLVTEDARLAECIHEPHNTGYEWAGCHALRSLRRDGNPLRARGYQRRGRAGDHAR